MLNKINIRNLHLTLKLSFQETGFGEGGAGAMMAGLSFRAIVELINSNNESGLKSFLDTQHANIDDRNEVKIAFVYCN